MCKSLLSSPIVASNNLVIKMELTEFSTFELWPKNLVSNGRQTGELVKTIFEDAERISPVEIRNCRFGWLQHLPGLQ